MLPYKVLGVYQPKILDKAWKVGKHLVRFTASLGLVPHIDPMHGPIELSKSWFSAEFHAEVRKKTNPSSAEEWHYDGDDTPGANPNCFMVLWASNNPTLIKDNITGKVYQPNPYEIVLIDNMAVTHRRPDDCPRDRWLFRQRVAPKPELLNE